QERSARWRARTRTKSRCRRELLQPQSRRRHQNEDTCQFLERIQASMDNRRLWVAALVGSALSWQTAVASERLFTYTYEPETLPKGTTEFEQWVTLRSGRDEKVGQEDYTRWELRE